MICVTEIKYIETDMDFIQLARPMALGQHLRVHTDEGTDVVNATVFHEFVRGMRFTSRYGKTLVLGNSEKVNAILGMQMEAWDGINNRAEAYRQRLDELIHASLLTRIKWLFTGVKVNWWGEVHKK